MSRKLDKTIAFIGGSGLAQGLETVLENVEHLGPVINQFGTVLSYHIGYRNNLRVIILPRHGDSTEAPSRSPAELVDQKGYEANIWELYKLKVEAVYGFTAVGALDLSTPLADQKSFVVPTSFIRGLAASQHSFGKHALVVHPSMLDPFNENLRNKLTKAITDANCSYIKGTYIYNGGDIFETSAEVRMLVKTTQGEPGRVLGMTTVPEAILLAQMRIPFATIGSNVNYGTNLIRNGSVNHQETLRIMRIAAPYLIQIANNVIDSHL
jgi:purine nucleoside phosphorylase